VALIQLSIRPRVLRAGRVAAGAVAGAQQEAPAAQQGGDEQYATMDSDGAADARQPLTEEEALAEDAQWYAADRGVGLEEAVRRLRLQESVGELSARLQEEERETFGGLWIEHEPEYRVKARFTEGGEEKLRRYVEGGPLDGTVEVEALPADATLEELQYEQQGDGLMIDGTGQRSSSLIDVSQNRVEVSVTAKQRLLEALDAKGARLPAHVQVTEVSDLGGPDADSYAGRRMFTPGVSGHVCTSGFSVRRASDGVEGVLTAAHCSDPDPPNTYERDPLYYGSPSGTYLPRQGRRYYGSWDMEWHTTPGFDDRALFFDGAGDLRRVYGLKRRSETSQGDLICDYGRTSGYPCSYVNSIYAKPPSIKPVNATFIQTYVAKPGEDPSLRGDSSGPTFIGGDAAGIISGGKSTESYHFMWYTASGYAEDMGLRIQVW